MLEETHYDYSGNYKKRIVNNYATIDNYLSKDIIGLKVGNRTNYLKCQNIDYYYYEDRFNYLHTRISNKWMYLTSSTTYEYDQNNDSKFMVIHTDYDYSNDKHAQLTKETITDSGGNTIKTEYFYPQDYNSVLNFPTLIDNHIISKPVDVRTYNNNQLISGTQTKYNDYGQPTDVYVVEIEAGIANISFDSNTPYSFTHKAAYQYAGNHSTLTQVSPDNNINTAYLWGYNNTLPIAKIDNASITQVESALGTTNMNLLNGNTLTSQHIRDKIDLLRNHTSMSNAMVTTYTYDPLIGITSQTDPAGITTNYEYDDFGRLESVKDHNGDIVKAYDYHYKPPPELSVSETSLSYSSSVGNKTASIISDVAWTRAISYDDPNVTGWISTSPTSGSGDANLTISVTTNGSATSRSGTVTISDNSGSGLPPQSISISQQGVATYLTVNPTIMDFTDLDSDYFDITSNTTWEIDIYYYDEYDWIGDIYPDSGSGNRSSIEVEIIDMPSNDGEIWEAEIEISNSSSGASATIYVTVEK